MKISEKKDLLAIVKNIKTYASKNTNLASFYENIESLKIKSLQDSSLENDLTFFANCQFVLNVIISILSHPHLTTKGENVILRVDQVHSLSNEMFLKTVRDPQLWKKQHDEYIPEYVHYRLNVDEIKIYENIFLIKLIDLIEMETIQYASFYETMIKTLTHNQQLSENDDSVQRAFENLSHLKQKLQKIKNTSFYKVVSKAKYKFKALHPTNILLKDRAYNVCFKFYKYLITYQNQEDLHKDFNLYYFCLMLQVLKTKKFTLNKEANEVDALTTKKFTIKNKEFKLNFIYDDKLNGWQIKIKPTKIDYQAVHFLRFDMQELDLFNKVDDSLFDSAEIISLWSLMDENYQRLNNSFYSEYELIQSYLESKMKFDKASYRIYSSYCPICKEKNLMSLDDINFKCFNCHSKYIFDDSKQTVWYLKIRRC